MSQVIAVLPAKRKHFCLGAVDLVALDYLKKRLYLTARAAALRQALGRLADGGRHALGLAPDDMDRLRESVRDMLHKAFDPDEPDALLQPWNCSVGTDGHAHIKLIRTAWGLAKDSEAIRLAIRACAAAEGFVPPHAEW